MKPILKHYHFAEDVVAFSTTRKGGVSEGKYGEFNINAYCGDLPEHIVANKKLLAEVLGLSEQHIFMPHQVHGTEIRQIGKELGSMPASVRQMILEGVDAVMTNVPGYCIGVSTADCIPVLLYDEEYHAAAAIHAGWRGTVARIVMKTIAMMHTSFGTAPQHLKAVVGPGISLEHFEVGDEVYKQFAEAAFDMKQLAELRPNTAFKDETGCMEPPLKWHINLPLCNVLQLQQAGVLAQNIEQTDICTYAQSDEYFSARRLGIESGRIYTAIILK